MRRGSRTLGPPSRSRAGTPWDPLGPLFLGRDPLCDPLGTPRDPRDPSILPFSEPGTPGNPGTPREPGSWDPRDPPGPRDAGPPGTPWANSTACSN